MWRRPYLQVNTCCHFVSLLQVQKFFFTHSTIEGWGVISSFLDFEKIGKKKMKPKLILLIVSASLIGLFRRVLIDKSWKKFEFIFKLLKMSFWIETLRLPFKFAILLILSFRLTNPNWRFNQTIVKYLTQPLLDEKMATQFTLQTY